MGWVELLKTHSITHISLGYCELMWVQPTSFRRVLALSISASTKNFCVANDQILSNIDLSTFIIKENSSFIDFDDDHLFEDEASNEVVSFNAISFNAIASSKNISSVRTTRKTSVIAKKIESFFRKITKLLKITKTKFRVNRKYIDSSLKNILILMKQ
jgi:hypothetical protein